MAVGKEKSSNQPEPKKEYTIAEAHLWIGETPLPMFQRGRTSVPTAAPGQFPYSPEIAENGLSATYTLCDVDTPFYVSAHAVIEWCERIEREGIDQ